MNRHKHGDPLRRYLVDVPPTNDDVRNFLNVYFYQYDRGDASGVFFARFSELGWVEKDTVDKGHAPYSLTLKGARALVANLPQS